VVLVVVVVAWWGVFRGSDGKFVDDACGGGGGSYNVGKDQQRDCCYNTAGHGLVTITLR